MKTDFSLAQLADPDIREADKILRACVHCGFCTATCPTYVLLGDELDSPRGRIYLMKEMLEKDQRPTADVVKHVDRCLSCLACMTTCPSGVNYMHLVDQTRVKIERDYARPLHDRLLRAILAWVLPRPGLFRAAMVAARFGRPLAALLPSPKKGAAAPTLSSRLKAMLALAPAALPAAGARAGQVFSAIGERRGRVALLQGCAQQVLSPDINASTIRLLTRHGIEVVLVADEQCCGALTHHLGRDGDALARARGNIDVWLGEAERGGLDAIVVTTSGCGTVIKDYGYMLREDKAYAGKAARVSGLALDISEYLSRLELSWPQQRNDLVVAYHAACSLQHGQKITSAPKDLLSKSGFVVKDIAESHLCCGSAGTYNILQPEIAERLRQRKVLNIASISPDIIAAGNIGCMMQIAEGIRDRGSSTPVVHTVELIDWATGGPRPRALASRLPGAELPQSRPPGLASMAAAVDAVGQ
jgi:glycolate oxidase iron-sulfur subunit